MTETKISDKWGEWAIFQRALCKKGYLKILSRKALKTYIALLSHADIETGKCWPENKTLMEETGLCRTAQSEAITELKKAKLIKIWQHRKDKSQQWGKRFYKIELIEEPCPLNTDIYPRPLRTDIYGQERDEKGKFKEAASVNNGRAASVKGGSISHSSVNDGQQEQERPYEQDQKTPSFSCKDKEKIKETIRELIQARGESYVRKYLSQHGYNPNLVNEVES